MVVGGGASSGAGTRSGAGAGRSSGAAGAGAIPKSGVGAIPGSGAGASGAGGTKPASMTSAGGGGGAKVSNGGGANGSAPGGAGASSGAGSPSSASTGRYMWWVNCFWKAPPPPTLTPPPSPLATGVPSGSVTAVWPPFQPITKALGAVPYWNPRANNAASSFPVLNRSPKTGLSVAAFAIHEASPEQSVPAGES